MYIVCFYGLFLCICIFVSSYKFLTFTEIFVLLYFCENEIGLSGYSDGQKVKIALVQAENTDISINSQCF